MSVIYGAALYRQTPAKMTVINRPKGRNVRKRLEAILKIEFNSGRIVIKRYGKRWHVYTDRLSEAEVRRAATIVASSDAQRVEITHHSTT